MRVLQSHDDACCNHDEKGIDSLGDAARERALGILAGSEQAYRRLLLHARAMRRIPAASTLWCVKRNFPDATRIVESRVARGSR